MTIRNTIETLALLIAGMAITVAALAVIAVNGTAPEPCSASQKPTGGS